MNTHDNADLKLKMFRTSADLSKGKYGQFKFK